MKKNFIVSVQETVCQNFIVEADNTEAAIDIAADLYKKGELIIDNGEVAEVEMFARDENDPSDYFDWITII